MCPIEMGDTLRDQKSLERHNVWHNVRFPGRDLLTATIAFAVVVVVVVEVVVDYLPGDSTLYSPQLSCQS